jgi:HK97 family phage prohead protease
MDRKTKYFNIKLQTTDDEGTIEGYGNTFGNIDSYGDIVEPGAFTKTLADRGDKVKLLWQHDATQPIGVWDSLQEDKTGLAVKGRINLKTQRGREAHELLKMGALDGLSIGFIPVRSEVEKSTGINRIKEAKLFEVSLVTFPANEQSTITAIKQAFDNEPETLFEELDTENRVKVVQFINNLKQSPLQSTEGTLNVEASTEKRAEESEAGRAQSQEPQSVKEDDEVLHSLEQLIGVIKTNTPR